jgi:hypothetical protein
MSVLYSHEHSGCGLLRRPFALSRAVQSAALHFVNGARAVEDLDVWSFDAAVPTEPFPYRRIGNAEFGPSRFGRWSGDSGRFIGRNR